VEEKLEELRRRLAEVDDLRAAAAVLSWDQLVMMPPGGASVRAERLATLERVAHDAFVDDRIGVLLDDLAPLADELPSDSLDASLIRVTRRDYDKAIRVPSTLAAEMTKTESAGMEAWVAAREANDYDAFRPWLERHLDLKRRYIECFVSRAEPYDVLLDDFEPGMTTAEVRTVFEPLAEALPVLLREASSDTDDAFMHGPFEEDGQRRLSLEAMTAFGYDPGSFRFDVTVHPFCTRFATSDVRVTTRYREDSLESLFSSMHEIGHGVYEHGVDARFDRTPLASGCSSALHESQSRLWENIVGRSLPFWRWFYPRVQGTFPDALEGVSLEAFHRAVNRVQPSFIRVDADEVSYGLHIILRFELEQDLLSGALSTADLPEAWNARFAEYLGLEVPEPRLGVLQDVHWSAGSFGYFPTYQVGNVMSVQIWEAAHAALPGIEEEFERGDFSALAGWLRENLYALGRSLTPQETFERVAGGPLDPGPYLRYLRKKYGAGAAV
jgi:carboxypeptidase Taq